MKGCSRSTSICVNMAAALIPAVERGACPFEHRGPCGFVGRVTIIDEMSRTIPSHPALRYRAAAAARGLIGQQATRQRWPLLLAAVLTIAHTFTTARAAPINFSQRAAGDDEAALTAIFARFERWQTVRAGLQLATFLLMLWALATNVLE
jgi:hypothetical protein